MKKLSDLLAFVQKQSRIKAADYLDPYRPADGAGDALRFDRARRKAQRRACFLAFPARLKAAHLEALQPGRYGRLSIAEDGQPSYVVGQYAALEVWPALLSYLEATAEAETSRWTARGPGAAIDQPWQALRPLC